MYHIQNVSPEAQNLFAVWVNVYSFSKMGANHKIFIAERCIASIEGRNILNN